MTDYLTEKGVESFVPMQNVDFIDREGKRRHELRPVVSNLLFIKKQMDEHGLFSTYTIQSLLDELDVIEYYQQPGKAHHLSEITQKQRDLYEMMNVPAPT